ncbi:MAG: hypothetical protein M3R68_01015 [Acidobacteriota bacterium]|nr:hypothetical protein [Acidobacteriota bacterium]
MSLLVNKAQTSTGFWLATTTGVELVGGVAFTRTGVEALLAGVVAGGTVLVDGGVDLEHPAPIKRRQANNSPWLVRMVHQLLVFSNSREAGPETKGGATLLYAPFRKVHFCLCSGRTRPLSTKEWSSG